MRALIAIFLMITAVAAASQESESGWYAGVGIGSFSYTEANAAYPALDDTVSAVKFFGGFKWNANWGLELAYSDSAAVETTVEGVDFVLGPFTSVYGSEMAALTVRPMAYLPMSWGTLFGGLGYFEGDRSRSVLINSQSTLGLSPSNFSESDNGATLLLGTEWPIGAFRLRAEYEWLDLDRASGSSLGFGLSYRF